MATDTSRPLQATVEDYFSDDGHGNGVQIEAFTPDPSPGKANVRTKRSNPENLGTDKTPTGRVPNNCDVKSDSGYSSQSVAGMSSADSAASATSQRSPPAIPAKTVPAGPSPTPAQRPARPHQRSQSTQGTQNPQTAPRQPPLSRRDSQASRRPPATERPERLERRPTITQPAPKQRDSRNDDCTVPGCTKCGPDAIEPRPRQTRHQSLLHTQPAESAPDVSYPHPYDTRSQVSDPAQYPASSPREGRPPRMYHTSQGGPVIQPAISRRLSVNSRQARPTIYHGDSSHNWQQPGMHSSHPSPPHEHGPPPSRSAGYGMPYGQPPINSPYMPQYPHQNPPAAFYQAQQMQPQPTYDQKRPPLQVRASTSSGYGHSMQPVVQVSRSDRQIPSARYHPNTAPPAAVSQRQQQRVEYRNQNQYDDSESESDSMTESEEEYEQDYHGGARRIMAPPESRPQKGASKRRPSTLRHAHTTPAPPAPESRPRHPQTVVIPDARDSRVRDRNHDPRPDRRSSMSRPPLVPSIKSQLAYDTPQARVIVEGPRSSRRNTLQAYDRTFKEHHKSRQQEYNETRRTNRSSKIYDNVAVDYERDYYDDEEEAEAVARAPLRRRDTDAEARRRPQRPVEVKQTVDAENYINSRRGDRETYADQTYEIAKKKSSRVSGPSEAESSRSRGSNDNGEIRLRIGNDAPVTLSLNGDMEGRTLQLVPIENGMNELVISSNTRGGESIYRSERGSIRGERKAIMSASQTRRDLDEMTERSSQSSRRRRETRGERDEPRHLLRRPRREPEYLL